MRKLAATKRRSDWPLANQRWGILRENVRLMWGLNKVDWKKHFRTVCGHWTHGVKPLTVPPLWSRNAEGQAVARSIVVPQRRGAERSMECCGPATPRGRTNHPGTRAGARKS